MIEDFRQKLREAIKEDPILPVAQHYERELSEIKVWSCLLAGRITLPSRRGWRGLFERSSSPFAPL